MTLTTETIKQWRSDAENIARRSCEYETEYSAAEAILALTAELLANREAQPVAYIADCGTIFSESDPFFDDYKNPQPLYTAPPAPSYPERLPCPVHLLPGLKFGKGVPTRSMLDALVRRAEYEAELGAMTPEQKTENDERLEKLKALIPPPAPAVNSAPDFEAWFVEKYKQPSRLMKNGDGAYKFSGVQMAFSAWSDGRAAMLAQPVSQRYTLPDSVLVLLNHIEDVLDDENWNRISVKKWNAVTMLAAAPEGGNDHDTGR
ncbi:TPA: hypothetical protein SLN38_003839 [Serratia marcescens]|nr:hypothetical protein [Serratia marcescens]